MFNMKNTPRSFLAALVLILIQAVFWLIFSFLAASGSLPDPLASGTGRWMMAMLAFGVAVLLGSLVLYIHRRRRTAYYGSLIILALIAILSITDEVGLFDWISLITSLGALALLIYSGSWYLDPASMEREGD